VCFPRSYGAAPSCLQPPSHHPPPRGTPTPRLALEASRVAACWQLVVDGVGPKLEVVHPSASRRRAQRAPTLSRRRGRALGVHAALAWAKAGRPIWARD
jgi:uncharacterized protein YjeT (DUF2065 family)